MELLCAYKDSFQYRYKNEEEMDAHIALMTSKGHVINYATRIHDSQRPFFGCIMSREPVNNSEV